MNIKIDALNYYGATKKYHLHFPALREDIEADVVIIGGGFSALTPPLSWRNRASPTWWCWRRAISATAAPGATAAR
jgi:hypothetical protein